MAATRTIARLHRRQQAPLVIIERVLVDWLNPLEAYPADVIRQRFRFWPETIMFVLSLQVPDVGERESGLPPLLALLCLWYLATGGFQNLIGDSFRVSQSTVCRSVWAVVLCILQVSDRFVKWHVNEASRTRSQEEFFNVAGSPTFHSKSKIFKLKFLSSSYLYIWWYGWYDNKLTCQISGIR